MQRRAAMALLSFVVVVGVLGAGVFVLAGGRPEGNVISSIEAGQQALEDARTDLQRVSGPGIDLVANDPTKADRLLRDAIAKLDLAATAGIAHTTLDPIRVDVVAALDRLYKMVDVIDTPIFSFPNATPVDLKAIVPLQEVRLTIPSHYGRVWTAIGP
jgi:hypothetical protein